MTPRIVVDIGNTRIKWGLCGPDAVTDSASLPADDADAWRRQFEAWRLDGPLSWAVSAVHPPRRDRLVAWLRERGDAVQVLEDPKQLPLRVLLEHPERVGIDRLLDAVAANSRRRPGAPAVIVDAGSAVTVDWLDETGAFRGGAILPGWRLMARSLHDYTALLPLLSEPKPSPPVPGVTTIEAMYAGIFWAVAGGVCSLIEEYGKRHPSPPDVFVTGGDGPLLHPVLGLGSMLWPQMTLEGIRLVGSTSEV
jgi:type III pantothenate kinase